MSETFYVRYRGTQKDKWFRRKFDNESEAEYFYLEKYFERSKSYCPKTVRLINPKVRRITKRNCWNLKPPQWTVEFFDYKAFKVVRRKFTKYRDADFLFHLVCHDRSIHNQAAGTVQLIRPNDNKKVKCFRCEIESEDKGVRSYCSECGEQLESYLVPRYSIYHWCYESYEEGDKETYRFVENQPKVV